MAKHFDIIIVDLAKLRDYCLNEEHPRGRHKARVFRSRLGLTAIPMVAETGTPGEGNTAAVVS